MLRELRTRKLKGDQPVKRVELRKILVHRWGVKQPSFYKVLAQMEESKLIQITGEESIVSLTDLGREMSERIEWDKGQPSLLEERLDLRSKIQSKLKEVIEDIQDFAEIKAIPYRHRKLVWNSVAHLYNNVREENWVMAQGADLEDKTTNEDISSLLEKMRKCVVEGKVLRRIQPLNTWLNWLKFLRRLLVDEEGNIRSNFQLYLMEDQPEFITQVNIKDDDEVILVPLEKGRQRTYGIHILQKEIVKGHRSDFEKWQQRCQGPLYSPKLLDVLVTNLQKLRELQTQCLVIHEIERQRKYYSGSNKFTFLMSYDDVQEYFPLDRSLWESWLEEWFASKGKQYLKKYCRTVAHNDLSQALGKVFEDKHTLLKDQEKPVELFAKESIPAIASDTFTDPVLKSILKKTDVRRASREVIRYVSRHCIPYLLTTAFEAE